MVDVDPQPAARDVDAIPVDDLPVTHLVARRGRGAQGNAEIYLLVGGGGGDVDRAGTAHLVALQEDQFIAVPGGGAAVAHPPHLDEGLITGENGIVRIGFVAGEGSVVSTRNGLRINGWWTIRFGSASRAHKGPGVDVNYGGTATRCLIPNCKRVVTTTYPESLSTGWGLLKEEIAI
jgi:hypothetical protein